MSTRTMVGLVADASPASATEPRYFVAPSSPLKLSPTCPVWPMVAVAGAVTVMFPASVDPSSHWNNV